MDVSFPSEKNYTESNFFLLNATPFHLTLLLLLLYYHYWDDRGLKVHMI